jgi:hypothetical protein
MPQQENKVKNPKVAVKKNPSYLKNKKRKQQLKQDIKSSKIILPKLASGKVREETVRSKTEIDKAKKTAQDYGKATGKNIMTGKKLAVISAANNKVKQNYRKKR